MTIFNSSLMIFFYLLLGLVLAFAIFYKFVFLRDRHHDIPSGNNLVAPASGRIISIETIDAGTDIKIRKGFFGQIEAEGEGSEAYVLINIFMSPLDEHYTKMPCDGSVENIVRTPGTFRAVNTLQAGLANEKQEFLLQTAIGKVKVIQIAGFLARRTRSFVQIGQSLRKGEKLGVILLGSQVAILFPKRHFALQVKVGDRVHAGETILCELA